MAAISYGKMVQMLKNTNKQNKQSHTSLEKKKKKNYSIPQKQYFPTSPSLDMNVINGSN